MNGIATTMAKQSSKRVALPAIIDLDAIDGIRDTLIDALEGWEFEGPKGTTTIREGDHALIQPMFTAKLVQDGDAWTPELIETVPADQVAPPETSGR